MAVRPATESNKKNMDKLEIKALNKVMINKVYNTSGVQREAYRNLRTNIVFTGTENRCIMLTSCEPGEGKSTVSFALASAFAENDKKTVLIDADMRRSTMNAKHRISGVKEGLSSFLSGQSEVDTVVYTTDIANLYFIPCGMFPTNPTELIGGERFGKLLHALKNSFDYILIDTPPLGSVIDAAVIASRCDGSILVISDNDTRKKEARWVVDQLKKANANILGAVLNKADLSSGHREYSKNYYYSSYYTDDDADTNGKHVKRAGGKS